MTDQASGVGPAGENAETLSPSRVEDVFTATEDVRAAEYPHVSGELLRSVLAAERDNPEDRAAAARAVGRAIETYLASHPHDSRAEGTDGGIT